MSKTENLKQKTVKGTAWSFIDNIAGHSIKFVVGIVLANILSPSEYGLVAVVSIFVNIFGSLVDGGFSSALIRKKNATGTDYNTIFIFNLVVSCFLYMVLYVCAPMISEFFDMPELTVLTRVTGCVILINALAIIQRVQITKRVDFKTQTKISIISSTLSGVVGVTLAMMGCGVWSLVYQQLARQMIITMLFWLFNRWIPRLEFSKASFNEMFAFGWKLLVSGLIDNTWKQIYRIIVGKFYSPDILGQYGRAGQFRNVFSTNINGVIQRVSYPVLCSIQDDKERLKAGYRRIIKMATYITFICMMGLAAIAKPMVLVLIGEKWLPSVLFLQIICFIGMMYPLHSINLNMLQVQGRSDLFLKLEIIKKVIAVGPIMLGIFIDIHWMLIGSVFTGFFGYYLNSRYSGRYLGYSTLMQIKDILPSFGLAISMAIPVYFISYIDLPPIYLLIMQLALGATLVVVLSKLYKIEEYTEIKSIIASFIKKRQQ